MITTTYKMTKSLHGGSAGDLPTASKLTTIRDRLRARPDYHYARRLRLLTIALCLLLGAASANKRVMERLVRLESFNDNHVPATQPRRRLGEVSNEQFIGMKVMIRNCHREEESDEPLFISAEDTKPGTFGARPFGSPTGLSAWETFTIEKHPMGGEHGVVIKTHWNTYWKFGDKATMELADKPLEWERIDIINVPEKDVATYTASERDMLRFPFPKDAQRAYYGFKSLQHPDSYFRSWPDGHCDVAPRLQSYETFQIMIVGGPDSANEKFIGKKVTIRNHHKKFIQATQEGTFHHADADSTWETFTIEKHPMGGVAIKTHWNKYWKFYNGGDKAKVDCEPDRQDEWERIDIVKVDGGYAFQSLQHTPANGNPTETFFRSWPDGHCDVAPHRQYWETFQINIV